MTVRILIGDCREKLREMPDASVNCCVTSPPYFGLRDYGINGQIGLGQSLSEYVSEIAGVFREVRRVLHNEGTLWLNIGDTFIDKSLAGIPWRVALALQDDGWILRQDIIWNKPNAMPEPARDRCVAAHEYLFLLSKQQRYYFDAKAIAEQALQPLGKPMLTGQHKASAGGFTTNGTGKSSLGSNQGGATRNRRSVWDVPTQPFGGPHFAAFPPKLVEPCILAGCPLGGTVLDPFFGAGTTGLVADRLAVSCIGIELNPEYAEIARRRIASDAGLFGEVAA